MTTTTAYTVDEFIDDVREIFDDTQDPLAQASRVAEKMEVLLTTPGLAGGAAGVAGRGRLRAL